MKLGVCETVIRTGFESDVAMAAAAGFEGMGIDHGRALDAGLDVARRALDDSGVAASSLIGAGCNAEIVFKLPLIAVVLDIDTAIHRAETSASVVRHICPPLRWVIT